MAIPSFDGVACFGPAPYVLAKRNPPERWWHGYPGVHGLQTVVGGTRGATASATGVLAGDTLADLAAAQNVFEVFKEIGGPAILIDTKGVPWPAMILIDFEPVGPILRDDYGVCQDYRAIFKSTI